MLDFFRRKDLLVRILLGVVVGLLGVGMLLYLVPGNLGPAADAANVVATVEGSPITVDAVNQFLSRVERDRAIPATLKAFYARQIAEQMIFDKLLQAEAKRLGIRVSDQERADRIKLLLPTVFEGGTFAGLDRYTSEVQERFRMGVAEFEERIHQSVLEGKIVRLVTDGVAASPEEVEQEYRRRNERVKIEYAVFRPTLLEARITPSEADLSAYFEAKKAQYQVPERRAIRYVLLDPTQLRQRVSATEEELRAYYIQHTDIYRVQDRARVSHVLFKTVGKSEAEVEEIRRKAEETLRKAKRGAKFEDLAKQYSEDTTKDAGGDLGWIITGQTVPEFERVAFSLPKGSISDLVKTQYGFHIIKVVDRETARTKPLDEVRDAVRNAVLEAKSRQLADHLVNQLNAAVTKSARRPLEEIGRELGLPVAEASPAAVTEPVGELGAASNLLDAIFRLRPGELSSVVRIDRGHVVLTVTAIQPAHQATLAEVRDRVIADYQREKSPELARKLAEECSKRAKAGEALAAVAKALGVEAKTSEPFARTGSVNDLGSARQLSTAYTLAVGQVSGPTQVGDSWAVFRVTARDEPKPEEFEKQRKSLEQQVLQAKRDLAYEAFRSALRQRMEREGKLRVNAEVLQQLSAPAGPSSN